MVYYDTNTAEKLIYYSTNRINTLSLAPEIYEDLKKYALDPYIATRQAYHDYRKSIIQSSAED